MTIEHVRWPLNMFYCPKNMVGARRTCSMSIEHILCSIAMEHGVWPQAMLYGHRACSMAIHRILWTIEQALCFNGSQRMSYAHRRSAMAVEQVLWSTEHVLGSISISRALWPQNRFCGPQNILYGHGACCMAMGDVLWPQNMVCGLKQFPWQQYMFYRSQNMCDRHRICSKCQGTCSKAIERLL